MDGYTKQKYREAVGRAVTKATNELIESGKVDKNTVVSVNVKIGFLLDQYIHDQFTINGVVENN